MENFGYIIIGILISTLISTLIFIVLFFIINSFYTNEKISKIIFKRKTNKMIFYLIAGVIVGLTSLINLIQAKEINIMLITSLLFIFSFYLSPIFLITSAPITLISFGILLSFNNDVNNFIVNAIFLAIICLVGFISWLITFKNNITFFIYISLILILSAVISPLVSNDFNYLFYYTTYFIIGIISILLLSFIHNYIKFSSSMKHLNESTLYKNGFIIYKYSKQTIEELIKKDGIKNGVIVIFKFSGIEKTMIELGAAASNVIKNSIQERIKFYFDDGKIILFLTEHGDIAAFIPTDKNKINLNDSYSGNFKKNRNDDDLLKEIENKINLIPINIKYGNKKYLINTIANCSIYGVQTNNIFDMIETLTITKEFTYDSKKLINKVQLFDPNFYDVKSKYISKSKVLNKLNLFTPNDIEISFDKVITTKTKKDNIYYASASIFNKGIFSKEQLYNLTNKGYNNDIIKCHIAALSIKEFKKNGLVEETNNKLLLDYPMSFVHDSKFNMLNFINNVTSYGIKKEQIIFNVLFDEKLYKKEFLKNIDSLKSKGISISIWDINSSHKNYIKEIKPDFIKVKHNLDLPNYKTYYKYLKNNIKYPLNKSSIFLI